MKGYLVTLRLRFPDDDVTANDVKDYVTKAVGSYGGSFPPDDPFFGMRDRLVVSSVKREMIPKRRKKVENNGVG